MERVKKRNISMSSAVSLEKDALSLNSKTLALNFIRRILKRRLKLVIRLTSPKSKMSSFLSLVLSDGVFCTLLVALTIQKLSNI